MTTSSNGRVAEYVEGLVEDVNERGLRLGGESAWRNFSRWAGAIAAPSKGQRVRLALDDSGFVRSVKVLDHRTGSGPSPSAARERGIVRQACLKAAASFCAGKAVAGVDVKSTDVLKIAEAFEEWVLAPEG